MKGRGETHDDPRRDRFPDFDDKVISLYARRMNMREIEGHLRELYGIDVSPELISTVTDAVHDQVAEWQNRPLEPLYPLVFFDALRVKVRDEGTVRNKAVYLALGCGERRAVSNGTFVIEVRRLARVFERATRPAPVSQHSVW
jgi:transposase-like protein